MAMAMASSGAGSGSGSGGTTWAGPGDADVCEYAETIGLRPGRDGRVLWLAEFALCSPLPEGWTVEEDHRGEGYYYEASTGSAQWEHPYQAEYEDLVVRLRKAIALTNAFPMSRNEEHAPPTLREVSAMATYLGFDVEREARIAWVAWQCCVAPLPLGWSVRRKAEERDDDGDDDVEYFEVGTGLVCDAHPLDSVFRMLATREKRIVYGIGNVDGTASSAGADSLLTSLNEGPLLLARERKSNTGVVDTFSYDFVLGREVAGCGTTTMSPSVSDVADADVASPATTTDRGAEDAVTPSSATSQQPRSSRLPLSSRRKGTAGYIGAAASASRHSHHHIAAGIAASSLSQTSALGIAGGVFARIAHGTLHSMSALLDVLSSHVSYSIALLSALVSRVTSPSQSIPPPR